MSIKRLPNLQGAHVFSALGDHYIKLCFIIKFIRYYRQINIGVEPAAQLRYSLNRMLYAGGLALVSAM
jgi:hypothetical protein